MEKQAVLDVLKKELEFAKQVNPQMALGILQAIYLVEELPE